MAGIRIQAGASLRLDGIYRYITGRFSEAGGIALHGVASKPIPVEFGVGGIFFRCEHHFVYRRRLCNGGIGIVAILSERMHQIDQFQEDVELGSGRA